MVTTVRAVAAERGYVLTTPDGADAHTLDTLGAVGRGEARVELDHPDTLDALVDWDGAFRVTRGGYVVLSVPGVYAPEAYADLDADGSFLPDTEARLREALAAQGWAPFSTTGQQGGGFVMHPSEYLGGALAARVLDTPGVYLLTEARGLLPDVPEDGDTALDDSPLGWLLLTRTDTDTEA